MLRILVDLFLIATCVGAPMQVAHSAQKSKSVQRPSSSRINLEDRILLQYIREADAREKLREASPTLQERVRDQDRQAPFVVPAKKNRMGE